MSNEDFDGQEIGMMSEKDMMKLQFGELNLGQLRVQRYILEVQYDMLTLEFEKCLAADVVDDSVEDFLDKEYFAVFSPGLFCDC